MVTMTVLVTGAAGFIGINLCKTLLASGHRVIGIDNFYCSSRAAVQQLAHERAFEFIEHDVINPLPSSLKADAVCNFACPASPVWYLKDPIYTLKTSVFGALNALEYASSRGIPILHASTSEVYGDPLEHPQTERYWGNVNPLGPRACYDEGKRAAESLCFDFVRTRGAKVKVIRIFNTYGPHMAPDDGRVMSNFIVQALAGQKLTVYGAGEQTRSFCFVDDLVAGIISFLLLPSSGAKSIDPLVHGPINLGNPHEITIAELATRIRQFIPGAAVEYKSLPEDDPKQRKPDISRARQVLGWEPKVALEEGMKKTVEWFSAARTKK